MTDHMLSLADGHLAYDDQGAGPLVVLLHGGAVDRHMWDPQVPSLIADHRAVRPDARGHGNSSTPTASFRHCDDVAALIDHLDAGPAVLVGLSMGARTAIDTALEHADIVRRVIASGAGAGEPAFQDPWILEIIAEQAAAQTALDLRRWTRAFVRYAAGPDRDIDDVDPAVIDYLTSAAAATVSAHVSPAAVAPDWVADAPTRLAEITVPVRAINGALDSQDHLNLARRTTSRVSDGADVLIDGAAHYPNLERPRDFNHQLLSFGLDRPAITRERRSRRVVALH